MSPSSLPTCHFSYTDSFLSNHSLPSLYKSLILFSSSLISPSFFISFCLSFLYPLLSLFATYFFHHSSLSLPSLTFSSFHVISSLSPCLFFFLLSIFSYPVSFFSHHVTSFTPPCFPFLPLLTTWLFLFLFILLSLHFFFNHTKTFTQTKTKASDISSSSSSSSSKSCRLSLVTMKEVGEGKHFQ